MCYNCVFCEIFALDLVRNVLDDKRASVCHLSTAACAQCHRMANSSTPQKRKDICRDYTHTLLRYPASQVLQCLKHLFSVYRINLQCVHSLTTPSCQTQVSASVGPPGCCFTHSNLTIVLQHPLLSQPGPGPHTITHDCLVISCACGMCAMGMEPLSPRSKWLPVLHATAASNYSCSARRCRQASLCLCIAIVRHLHCCC